MFDYEALGQAVVNGDRTEAIRMTNEALEAGEAALDIVEQGLVPGMAIIGEKFKCQEIYVPQMLIVARAMKESMAILEPLLAKAGIKPDHTAVVGTVQGDLHDIGKNLVAMMFKGANYGVVDLGTNVSAETFIEAIKEHNADVLGLSALLTTTMPEMPGIVSAVRAAGLNDVKILVGGAPITQAFADKIGADGFAADAASAVDVASELVGV
jgi:5-methyltetrahydrofolate--homocysteine methyltransferase